MPMPDPATHEGSSGVAHLGLPQPIPAIAAATLSKLQVCAIFTGDIPTPGHSFKTRKGSHRNKTQKGKQKERQRNMSQMEEYKFFPEKKILMKGHINLSDKEFKVMVVKMFTELITIEEHSKKFNR